jgi:tellurite resistance protein TehA-like permease
VAISTLAGAHILLANTVHGASRTALHSTVDALLVLTGLGYLGLGFTELRWRRWRYQLQRWATVFPLGMTAAAAASASRAERLHWLHGVGNGLAGVAIAAWLVVAGGAAADLVRSEPAATSA